MLFKEPDMDTTDKAAEALRLADWLEFCPPLGGEYVLVAHFMREHAALLQAQAQALPVAWCTLTSGGKIAHFDGRPCIMVGPVGNEHHTTPLYTSHQPAEAGRVNTPESKSQLKRLAVQRGTGTKDFQPLTDEQLLAIAREEAHGDTIKLTREVGPYGVTEVTHVYRSIARAIEHHHGILPKDQP